MRPSDLTQRQVRAALLLPLLPILFGLAVASEAEKRLYGWMMRRLDG